MSILHAIIFGIVQGLTEFLPVSSTAHLRITTALLGLKDSDVGAGFTAIIQLGTLAATIWYFWRDICAILGAWGKGIVRGKPFETHLAREGWFIIVATLPIVACGLLTKPWIKDTEVKENGVVVSITEAPLRTLTAVSIQLAAGSILMLCAELYHRWRLKRNLRCKEMSQIGAVETIGTGLFQCLALLPGVSRSGSTISGGLFLGLTRETAARFSFLLSLPAVFAAGVYSLWSDAIKPWRNGTTGMFSSSESILSVVIATVVSGIVGYFAIAFLIGYLKRYSMTVFVVYRLIAAAILGYAVMRGWLI